ncbi:hypothetical protein QZH41_009581 [Actinostola sp. cb2023]|nr:hypothetical protein QZH41_009581 [Actinostola sp. cb2023]
MVVMTISCLSPPSQGVRHLENNTQAFIDDNCLGNGTLYVTEERLSWCDGQDCTDDDEDIKVGEVRFVPEDKGKLEQIYNVLSDCQALHPDPQEEAEEEMAGFGREYFTNEDEAHLTEEGQATLQRLESAFQPESEQDTMIITSTTNGEEHNGQNHHSGTQ